MVRQPHGHVGTAIPLPHRGDPVRDTIDLAVLDTVIAALVAHLADSADGAGYRRMLSWADRQAPAERGLTGHR
jgi:hypothetical protein